MKEIDLAVKGMSCQHCVKTIEEAVSKAGGKANVDLTSGRVGIQYESESLTESVFKTAIENAGYELA